ncbi:hypothetical protein CAJAP_04647 [Camponotus japonicus]
MCCTGLGVFFSDRNVRETLESLLCDKYSLRGDQLLLLGSKSDVLRHVAARFFAWKYVILTMRQSRVISQIVGSPALVNKKAA